MLCKLIETFVPEPFVLMHPSGDLPQGFRAKGDKDFATLFFALNESCSFEHFEMLGHGVESCVVGLCDIEESSRPVCELPDYCAPCGVGDGCQDGRELVHADITP